MSSKTITVTGNGAASGAPDVCRVNLGVSVARAGVGEAASEADAALQAMLAVLTAKGVAKEDIRTVDYGIHPEYEHRPEGGRFIGFRIRNQVEALVRSAEDVGDVLTAVVAAGGDAVEVQGLTFEVSDPAALLLHARDLAWADAVAKAGQLAKLAGAKLGPARRIEEGRLGPPGPMPMARLAMADSTPIEPGTSTLRTSITVTFSIGK
ncbi:MAG TPA: SIMPL domain-containing protein [Acidimicrobiia bacterium]|jgi:hypothetical protein